MDRAPLSFRLVEAADARLRRHTSEDVQRAAYRLGYLVLRPWWFVTRPRIRGTKAVVRRGDDVLLVRHAYARRKEWDMPGGFVKPGEDPAVAVRRELAEELGIEADGSVVGLGALPARYDNKREVIHMFRLDVPAEVEVRADGVEIAEVRWARHDDLPEETSPLVRRLAARAYWPLWDE